jgi:CheY-like chemotaxis protein
MNVLIVDDRPANLALLRAQLEAEGHAVRQAADGVEALAILDGERMDAVISDILMPRMDGYRLCDEVRKSPRLHQTPFIFYTATYMSPADEKLCLHLGADRYLRKPVAAQTLLGALHEAAQSTVPRTLNRTGSLSGTEVMKEYSERLVSKLEEQNVELTQAGARAQAQLGRLELLGEITRAIGERRDLRSIFQAVVRKLEDHLPVDFSCVCLYDPADSAITVTSVGIRSEELARQLAMPEQSRIAVSQQELSHCVFGSLVYEPDLNELQLPFPQRLLRGGLRALVVAPLLAEKNVFGMLVAARREAQSFSSPECEFLRQLSEHVALAAHQAQLYDTLQHAYDDLRESQQAVMHQERLRALGQMATGVAHDINNALSPAALYSDFLLECEPGLSERARRHLTTIRQSIVGASDTVGRLRQFSRPHAPEFAPSRIDLNRIIEEVVELTAARWRDLPQEHGNVIDVSTHLEPGLPDALGAEGEVRDACTNLIFNAVDAMPTGGTLTICTASVVGRGHDGSDLVQVEVQDSGIGMDEETRRRCLEPFFTTKGERGTGLGLAMVYGMVQRHHAELDIESAPGKGTTVRLRFAVATSAVESAKPTTVLHPTQPLRILIVDDDPLVIESLRDTLQSDGHCVVVADGGQAGSDTFRAAAGRGERFAVVITDLGMPYFDGRKVAAAVKAASPTTPVVLLTGWGQRMLADNELPPHVDRVLSKPPSIVDLRRTLAEISAQPSA